MGKKRNVVCFVIVYRQFVIISVSFLLMLFSKMFERSFEGVWIMLSLKIYWFTIHEIITTSLWGNCRGTKETTCYTICTFFPPWCSDVHSRHASNFETLLRQLAPTKNPSLINAMKAIKNPYKMCERLYKLVQSLTGQLKELINQKVYDPRGMIVPS